MKINDMYRFLTEYVHIVHFQSNVLVNDAGEACLCDIGVSNISFPQEWNQAHGTGSARWTAPELMNPKEDDDATCPATTQSDVYSLGMTILEVRIHIIAGFSEKDERDPSISSRRS